jgi:hypothetical protein
VFQIHINRIRTDPVGLKNADFTANKKIDCLEKTFLFLLDLHEGLGSSRRSFLPSRECIQFLKHEISKNFHFCGWCISPGSAWTQLNPDQNPNKG